MSSSGPLLQRHSFRIILGTSAFYSILFHRAVRILLGFVLIDAYHSFSLVAHIVLCGFSFFSLSSCYFTRLAKTCSMLSPRTLPLPLALPSDLLFLLCFLSCPDTYMDKAFIDLCTHHYQLFFQLLFGNDLARTSSLLPLFVFFYIPISKAGLRWLFFHPLAASAFAICQLLILAANQIAWCQFSHGC